METYKGLPIMAFDNFPAWLKWLEKNHDKFETEVWIKIAKKNTGVTTATYEELREGALMYGWIDGLTNKVDDVYYAIRFMRRRPKSTWSKINCGIAEQLISEGHMQPSGLEQVEAAKADGRWDKAY